MEHCRAHKNTHNGSTRKRWDMGAGQIFEEVPAENFPNLLKINNLHAQEASQTPNRLNTKRSMDASQ